MYTNRENLEATFRMIDLDSNGLITIDEFKQACELLSGNEDFYWYFIMSAKDLSPLKLPVKPLIPL